jgi:hypothetical protein
MTRVLSTPARVKVKLKAEESEVILLPSMSYLPSFYYTLPRKDSVCPAPNERWIIEIFCSIMS